MIDGMYIVFFLLWLVGLVSWCITFFVRKFREKRMHEKATLFMLLSLAGMWIMNILRWVMR